MNLNVYQEEVFENVNFPNEVGHLSEQILAYKRKRSRYVSKLTKTINKINELSKIDRYKNRLDLTIDKIRRVSSN